MFLINLLYDCVTANTAEIQHVPMPIYIVVPDDNEAKTPDIIEFINANWISKVSKKTI